MRFSVFVCLLFGLIGLCFLAGCDGDDEDTFLISGQVVNSITGNPEADAELTLYQNGEIVLQDLPVDFNGVFSVVIPEGRNYTVLIDSPGGDFVPLLIGPFRVEQDARNLEIPVDTEATIQTVLGIDPPPIGESTLIAGGVDTNFDSLPVDASVQGIASVPIGDLALVEGITPGTRTATVTTNGSTRTFTNVPFRSGEFTIINAIFGEYVLESGPLGAGLKK